MEENNVPMIHLLQNLFACQCCHVCFNFHSVFFFFSAAGNLPGLGDYESSDEENNTNHGATKEHSKKGGSFSRKEDERKGLRRGGE